MERKIGEIFENNGEWYQCVKGNTCDECSFNKSSWNCLFDGTPHCSDRSDEIEVVFKKLEKVGETFYSKYYGKFYQTYKTYIPAVGCNFKIRVTPVEYVGRNEIFIELKQNKEDMEEYRMYDAKEDIPEFDKVVDECLFGQDKLNLKPFDLEAAKAGKPVCTRDGRKARIICFDAKDITPIIALVLGKNSREEVQYYDRCGRIKEEKESPADLMMLPEKKEGWMNVYKERIYDTKEGAIKSKYDGATYIDTIKISWEE